MDIIFEECEMVFLQFKGMYNFFNLLDGVFFDWYVGISCVFCEVLDIMEVIFQQFYDELGVLEFECFDDMLGINFNC